MILRHIYKSIFACVIAISCISTANALSASYYNANSKLSSGHWVKIKVSEMGMQEISHDQLREWGFSDPSKVCVYGYGGALLTKNIFDNTQPDDLPAQPVYYGENKIAFYGEPDLKVILGKDEININIIRNMYSSCGYYFLSDCESNVSKLPNAQKVSLSNILNREYHNHIIYIENEKENPGQAGTFFFDKNLINNPQSYSFNATKQYISDFDYSFKYSFAAKVPAYTSLNVEFNHPDSLIKKAKHNAVLPSSLSAIYFYTSSGEISFSPLDTANATYSFNFNLPANANASYAAIDYAFLAYRRQNNFENEAQMRMSFYDVNQNTNFTITNSNQNLQVWNVTNPLNIYPHDLIYYESSKNSIGSFDKTYKYSSTGNACLIAFDPTKKLHQVEFVEKVENQNLHNLNVPNMVIITNNLCQPYAEQVAQAHRDYQGMDVLVINQKQIFNEFSSGTPSAMGYRRFLKMFYDRNKSKFKYLLLFGEGSWDNRGLIYPKEDRLLTYQAESVEDARSAAKAFCGDSYFGMLNDDFDPDYFYNNEVHIAIGRIPAQTATNAQAATNKIIKYLQNPPTTATFNRAVILADEGDSFGHIIQQEENADSILKISPATTCTRAYIPIYPYSQYDAYESRDKVIQALKQGQGFFSFAGHGGESSFTGKKLWSVSSINETNYNHSPIAMFATCDAFAFDRKDGGMAEAALYKENGGFIAVVAASRTVYMQHNQYINRAFTCELFNANGNDLIGDVFRRARNKAATAIVDRTLGVNTMCYNLAGDPAIPIYKPTLKVATSSINNVEIEENADSIFHKIAPLTKNTITGQITNKSGNIQKSFNGSVTLSIFDGPKIHSLYNDNNKNTIFVPYDSVITIPPVYDDLYRSSDSLGIILDENLLAEVTVPVTNGEFSATLITPISQRPNSVNRISYFAITDDKSTRANGYFNFITLSGYDETIAIKDETAPIIEQCYINEPTFNNGDIVESDFTLYATIAPDESGLNSSTSNVGLSTTLSLDGKKSFSGISSAIIPNADGSSSLSFSLNGIEDGHHTLTLSVNDNSGNRTNHTLSFVVINRSAKVELTVDKTPVRSEATFDINHNFMIEPLGRIVIEDTYGNTVFTKNDCTFPYTWNLKDTDNNLVNDGNYKAYVILNGGKQYGSSDKIDVIVIK